MGDAGDAGGPKPVLAQARALPPEVVELAAMSRSEGHRMIERLVAEWVSGQNRFERPGEAFFVARADGRLVGVGGLNVDGYLDDEGVGRVRHLYVVPAWRGRSVGRRLVAVILRRAEGRFSVVRVRAGTEAAGVFYDRIGFARVRSDTATHARPVRFARDDGP